jgi:transcription antitermination protein NusB
MQRTVSRRQARRAAFVLLYQHDVTDSPLPPLYERYAADTGEPVPPYTVEVVDGVSGRLEALDARIDASATGWTAGRLGAVERAILRVAVWELTERPDVPTAAVIDEAVELAKRYASPEAATFVNGVLGAVARAEGRGR